jgi:Tol biopolymer transport system component
MMRIRRFLLLAGPPLLLAAPPARAGHLELPYRVPPRRSADTASGSSSVSSLSADGRFLVFLSNAPNLAPGQVDLNLADDVFLYDRVAGTVTLVSRTADSSNCAADAASESPVISADGRWVAFVSAAQDLIQPRDPGTTRDVFLYDRTTGATTLVSRSKASRAIPANGKSSQPVLSADGRYLAFTSEATDLVERGTDANQASDVFRYDRKSGRTTLVSHAGSRSGNAESFSPAISADGRAVAFVSRAGNLVNGQTGPAAGNVFVYDAFAGTNVLVSHRGNSTTAGGDQDSRMPLLSANGAFVVYLSGATNLVAGQTDENSTDDVFLFNRSTGATTLVSHAFDSPVRTADEVSFDPAISADGGSVAFGSQAGDLVPDTNSFGFDDVFLFEPKSGKVTEVRPQTELNDTLLFGMSADGERFALWSLEDIGDVPSPGVDSSFYLYDRKSRTTTRVGPAFQSFYPALLSADGNWVAFTSDASDVMPETKDYFGLDVFLFGRTTGAVELVSRRDPALPSKTPAAASQAEGLSAAGRYAVFVSDAGNLLPRVTDTNDEPYPGFDVFLYDRVLKTTQLVSRSAAGPLRTANGPSVGPRISADGRWIIFTSAASDLAPGVTGYFDDNLFLFDRVTATNTLLSRSVEPPFYDTGGVGDAEISADGSTIVFVVSNPFGDLVPGQSGDPFWEQIYLCDRATGKISLVSHAFGSETQLGDDNSGRVAISPDGRFVVFQSGATNLLSSPVEPSFYGRVYLYDRATRAVSLIGRGGYQDPGPAVSADGRYVAFTSHLSDVVPGQVDIFDTPDLFLYDRVAGSTVLVSHLPGSLTTAGAASRSGPAVFTPDGRYLIFNSSANLLSGSSSQVYTAYVYDRVTGNIEAVSPSSGPFYGSEPDAAIGASLDGRYIAFLASTPVAAFDPVNAAPVQNVYLYDRQTRKTILVSAAPGTTATGGNLSSAGPLFVAADGSVLFNSRALNLVPGDFNGTSQDVFLYVPVP